MNSVISSFFKNQATCRYFDDYLCYYYLMEKPGIVESSIELDKLIQSIIHSDYKLHPTMKFYQKLLGVNGFSRLDIGLMFYILEIRESLILAAGNQNTESIPLQTAVEFIKKQFANVS